MAMTDRSADKWGKKKKKKKSKNIGGKLPLLSPPGAATGLVYTMYRMKLIKIKIVEK